MKGRQQLNQLSPLPRFPEVGITSDLNFRVPPSGEAMFALEGNESQIRWVGGINP